MLSNSHLWYVDMYTTSFIEIPPCSNMVIFIDEYAIWWKNPPFYIWSKKDFPKKDLRMEEYFFLYNFSSSISGRKYYYQAHIPFWPGTPKLNQCRIRCYIEVITYNSMATSPGEIRKRPSSSSYSSSSET